jgi:hypothetical protein
MEKPFKVDLLDKDGKTVLTHNLLATNEADAERQVLVLLDNVRNKNVCSAKVRK